MHLFNTYCVKLLEAQLETLKISHLHDEEQSIRVFEENEERESIISEQNLVSVIYKHQYQLTPSSWT